MIKKRPPSFSVLGAVGATLVLFVVYADGRVVADSTKQDGDQDPCGCVFAINGQNELLILNAKVKSLRGGEGDDHGNGGVKVKSRTPIGPLTSGDILVGIDFRPAGLGGVNQLYGLGRGAVPAGSLQLYYIDTETGFATAVGPPPPATTRTAVVAGMSFGFDFNPVTDRIRVTSDVGRNLRLNPDTGMVVTGVAPPAGEPPPDGSLAYPLVGADPNFGRTLPRVTAVAHANPDNVTRTSTVLYDIDAGREDDPGGGDSDVLAIQATPNSGLLHAVGRLLTDTGAPALALRGAFVGFDIGPENEALAVLEVPELLFSHLVSIDLLSGRSFDHGRIRGEQGWSPDELVTGLAIELGPECETPD